ncbi:MAG: META domain-containing protein [Ardenticatenaceae bacterium]|nr:META domain-containing protein [Ardenticatenaceae bacterium]
MNKHTSTITLLLSLILLIGCTAVQDENTNASLTGTTWILQGYHQPLLPDTTVTIKFTSDGQVNGSASCNSYFGSYTLDGGNLLTDPVGSTEIWCEGLMDQESAFLQALQSATGLTVTEDSLLIHTPEGDMQFTPAQNAALEVTDWVLNGIAQNDAVTSTSIDTDITIKFADGQVGGNAGCNSYGGSYQTDGSKLTLSGLASTLMACAEPDRNQRESEFLSALNTVTQFRTDMNQLILSNDAGQDVLFFTVSGS